MVKQVIEIGTAPAGQDGDSNREASIKINSNFTELYVAISNVVRGPSSAVGGEVAVFSGTTGKDIVGGGILGSAAFRAAGAANGVATLNASTKVPIAQLPTGANGLATLGADGKLPTAQLPPLAVNEVFTVASQAAMLALVAERGDVAVRSDQAGKTYILSQDDPTLLANWIPLQQALSAALAALNALTPAADRIPFFTGPSTADLLPITTIGKALIAVADAAAARTTISAAKSGANSDITSLTGITTPLSVAQGGTGKNTPVRETGQGYIEGLILQWNSGTSISVSPGAAYIESLGYVLNVPSAITLSGLSLSANAWFNIYLYSNSGVPALEVVGTAPAAPFNGKARSKTGDSSRRYLGAMRTQDASASLMRVTFYQGGKVTYNENAGAAPLQATLTGLVLNNPYTVNAVIAACPVTSHTIEGSMVCTTTGASLWVSNSLLGLSSTVFLHGFTTPVSACISFLLDTSTTFSMAYSTPSPNGALLLRLSSYYYER